MKRFRQIFITAMTFLLFFAAIANGYTWTTNKNLTKNAGRSRYPSVAVDGSNVYVVWFDDTLGNPEVYFKKSDDGGATWTKGKKLTNNAGVSLFPSIATDGSNIYVVWEDDTPGNWEIYFKKGVLF
jgi:Tol biopolymer transport system component